MEKPSYYVTVFGSPNPPEKDKVESGRYYVSARRTEVPGEIGDILLLYCTGNYSEHYMSVPGVGIVTGKDHDSVYYRYLPLLKPISKDRIDQTFSEIDKANFANIRFDSFWIFKISAESFRACLRNISIGWP